MATILQINGRVNMGSVSRITEQIGQLVLENHWESYIAYGRDPRPSNSKLIRIGSKWDIYMHKIYSLLSDRQGLGSVKATRQLIRTIIEIKPDLIHLQNIHGYYLNYKILFEFLATYDVPVVWTLHDCWSITGHCAHFVTFNCDKWQTECEHCPALRSYPKSLLIDNSKRNYQLKKKLFMSVKNMTLVPVSDWMKSQLEKSFLSVYPIHRIYNGIDTDLFFPRTDSLEEVRKKFGLQNKMILLGVATSWTKDKGLYDFYHLQNLLAPDEQIVLVGLSDKQLKKLPDNIVGIKRTENLHDLACLYSVADVVLNLSMVESFGLTTVEGLSCGTPGIVYRCTASPELISETTGFVVEPQNFNSLLAAIQFIKKRSKKAYTNSCRNRILENFKKEDRYQEYLDLYKKLLTCPI